MAYLEEFSNSIASRNYKKVMELWQEYCSSDEADPEEIEGILSLLKQPEVQPRFGTIIEEILPLVLKVEDENKQLVCLALLFDIQNTNTQALWDLAQGLIKTHFGKDPDLQNKLRLVGLKTKGPFQGAITNFILLNHIKKGHFVYHTAGWGVGEIIDASFLREQITLEFENLEGSKRDISFKNAYKSLKPLALDHVLSLRYGKPEVLGKLALNNSVELVIKIISDLGPKNAQEIKELLSGIIIDEDSYSKWWQSTRAKLKKDPRIDNSEDGAKARYMIRKGSITSHDRIKKALINKHSVQDKISSIYGIVRDFPKLLKEDDARNQLFTIAQELLQTPSLSSIQTLLIYFLLKEIDEVKALPYKNHISSEILKLDNYEKALRSIEVISFRKKLLMGIQEYHSDWENIFKELLVIAEPLLLKDYIMKELTTTPKGTLLLKEKLKEILEHPVRYPETFLWYFQKTVLNGKANASANTLTQDTLAQFFESFLLLYSNIEFHPDMKDLVKKMYTILTQDRFKLVRDMLKDSKIDVAKEFLLLTSKCRSLTDHDQKILKSLVSVAHPSLQEQTKEEAVYVLWTTDASYQKIKDKIHHLATVEVVENAREIEEARKLGDLRENSEYKFALEKRSRLQKELKTLSDQFQKARIISPIDITKDEVGIGTCVELESENGTKYTYTILGPWDSDTDAHILSIESKIAQGMVGKNIGDIVDLKGEKCTICRIQSIFDK